MIEMKDRKIGGVEIRADDLVRILNDNGWLKFMLAIDNWTPMPENTRLIRVDLDQPVCAGDAIIRLTFECDELPEEYLYKGYVNYVKVP